MAQMLKCEHQTPPRKRNFKRQKEIKLFRNRFFAILGVMSLVLVTIAMSNPFAHASPVSVAGANDFYQRHPDWTWASNLEATGMTIDMMRYRTTNQNLSSPTKSTDLSDYYLRHSELRVAKNSVVDTSDYFLRHPELIIK